MERIRLAGAADAVAVRAIYEPSVRDGWASFEEDVPTEAEIARRILATTESLPWYVLESSSDGVLGYCYASQHHERAAYRWSVDVSVYVSSLAHRRGVGRRLYAALLETVEALGYYRAFAGITLPNEGSVALHERFGFEPVGVYRDVGYKAGAWRDVGWWQRSLRELEPNPVTPMMLGELASSGVLAEILARHERPSNMS